MKNLTKLILLLLVSCNAFELAGEKTSLKGQFKDGFGKQIDLSFDHGNFYDYGSIFLGGAAVSAILTLRNTSDVDTFNIFNFNLDIGVFAYSGGTFPGTAVTCAIGDLGPGEFCELDVSFTPATAGGHGAGLTVEFYMNNDGQSRQMGTSLQSFTEAYAALTVNPTTVDYGTIATGSTTNATVTVTNSGTYDATSVVSAGGLNPPFSYAGGTYPGSGGTCGNTIAGQSNCTLVVSYSPVSMMSNTDMDNLNYFDANAAQTVIMDFQGIGAAPASLNISETDPYDFGVRVTGSSMTHGFIVTNNGGLTADSIDSTSLSGAFQFLGGSFPGTGGNCGASLAPAASCTIVVEFAPTGAGGVGDTIIINYFDQATSQSASREVLGTGVTPAILTISGTEPYDFGSITSGTTATAILTISNSGGFAASSLTVAGFVAPFSFNGGAYPGSLGTCGVTLNAGTTCDIDIEFAPTAVGSYTDNFQINYNDGASAQQVNRNLEGTGI